jgi:hypothetical protein
VGAAEVLVVVVIGGACYVALAPLRRAITRWMLRRTTPRSGRRVIPLVRDGDGVYTPSEHTKED